MGSAGANDHTIDFGFIPKPQADLVIVKYDALDPMVAGTALTYTIVLTNNGPASCAQRHCHRYLTSGHNAPIGHAVERCRLHWQEIRLFVTWARLVRDIL
ncbi:MAG: hypothetical protein R2867_16280 [Caldilineaceae bacterium]